MSEVSAVTNTSMISMRMSTSHLSGMFDGSVHGQGSEVGEGEEPVGEETGLGVALALQVPISL